MEYDVRKYNQKWGFGMTPLKSETEYKYKRAAYTVLKILKTCESHRVNLDDISTFKGMVNRCVRQDQWDWFTVYARFGEPNPVILRPIPAFMVELRNACKKSNVDEISKLTKKTLAKRIINLCEIFLNRKQVAHSRTDTGYIYILSKREEPKVLKIGMTNRDVEQRVKEINSATGVLFPLSVRAVFKVINARDAEQMIFSALEQYRIRKDREFFMVEFAFAAKLVNELLQKHDFLYESN